ncbi:hypothetical protein BB561_000352 [Smittium simulii]|uniref:Uncharacterized protein n=1 Tax=Smittium simulii TaxID=133385 RepID=A0A2T9YZK0_9FUNG|nr:hypothetical protein BB561_000352 [Smittium simulii]
MNAGHKELRTFAEHNPSLSISDTEQVEFSLLKKNEELEQIVQATKNKLENMEKNLKWLEIELSEEQKARKNAEQLHEEIFKKSALLEAQLIKEKNLSEDNRIIWENKEKKLQTDLKQARNNASLVRRNTVSIATRTRAGTSRYITPPYSQTDSTIGDYTNPHLNSKETDEQYLAYASLQDTSQSSNKQLASLASDLIDTKKSLVEKDRKLSETIPQLIELKDKLKISDYHAERNNEIMTQYQTELDECRQIIETLRDDNESYQKLLQMQSMSGQFNLNAYQNDGGDSKYHSPQQSKKNTFYDGSNTETPHIDHLDTLDLDLVASDNSKISFGANLGAQLAGISNNDKQVRLNQETQTEILELKEKSRVLKSERTKLQDENKALTLYITDILSRVLAMSGGMEVILDKDFNSKTIESPNVAKNPKSDHNESNSNTITDSFAKFQNILYRKKKDTVIKEESNEKINYDAYLINTGQSSYNLTSDNRQPKTHVASSESTKTSNFSTVSPPRDAFSSSAAKQYNREPSKAMSRSQTVVQKKTDRNQKTDLNSYTLSGRKSEEIIDSEEKKSEMHDKLVGSRLHSNTIHSSKPTWWNRFSQRFSIYDKDAVDLNNEELQQNYPTHFNHPTNVP